MSEVQILDENIRIDKADLRSNGLDSGGAVREVQLSICVDTSYNERDQKIALVHELIASYYGPVSSPDTISELAEHIIDAIETAYKT
jgi:hypothetical protein